MCKQRTLSRFNGQFSFDAAIALVFALFLSACFLALMGAAANSTQTFSSQQSHSLLALRASSEVLLGIEETTHQPYGEGGYSKTWEIDEEKAQSFDLGRLAKRAGAAYTSFSIASQEGERFSSSYGQPQGGIYCSNRLALLSNEMVLVKVCLS
ncbi:MAG: hypothetical protein NT051_02180 [Candidatus Micrarchaeota archaeon]|nr:hypothetical protein [Candidatus Micrarchaeota archaeon]